MLDNAEEKEWLYRIAFTFIDKAGPKLIRKFLENYDDVESIFKEKPSELRAITGIPHIVLRSLLNNDRKEELLKRAEKELNFIIKNKMDILWVTDKDYPERLKACPDAPPILYSKGDMNLSRERMISIVGTRKSTRYGEDLCDKIIEQLSEKNVTIVSGLAYGIDIKAHRAALNNNMQTISILPHGLDIIYPAPHKKEVKKMIENGGILTEFSTGSFGNKENFPRRNRIIAGISDATLVVESAEKGGALITADIAHSYNRDVLATPGKVNDPRSAGCNKLIKTQKAALVENAEDIAYQMNWDERSKHLSKQKELFIEVSEKEKTIVKEMGSEAVHVDILSVKTGKSMRELSTILLQLEMKGVIRSLPG
ncbi:MAG: DNA-processing protein DprA, partial [Flavobacteriales bacterium]